MVLRLTVTLSGIKGFYRVYHVNGDTSLYTFHKQMRADMEFPQDQLIMFKGLAADESVVGRYGLFDLGFGTVDGVTLSDAVGKGITHFVYFYDVMNRKSVNISIDGEVEGARAGVDSPYVVETKGPNPIEFENGYVAYEDLPDEQRHLPGERTAVSGEDDDDLDDEDFDDEDGDEEDDEEEDDDEEGKEIYDESEGI
ncbi:MAG: hypothetical protein II479_07465 [Bacteroidales bacterium]|nr:hypothetical protein [Bacteroidales bacterium]